MPLESHTSTSTTIAFTTPTIYGTYTTPIDATSYAENVVGAKKGIVQKAYMTGVWTAPASHVKIGGVDYDSSAKNIVYLEYSESGRIEYWVALDE